MKLIQISPSGFVAPYQLGICMYIKNHYDLRDTKFIGGSAGSWLAVYLASDIKNNDLLYNFMPKFKYEFEDASMSNKWKNVGRFLKQEIPKYIGNTEFIYNKNILISVSNIDNFKLNNEVIDNYDTLTELMQLCYLSSFIPLLSGNYIPLYKNKKFIDATFTRKDYNNVDLLIYPSMWGRKFRYSDYIGCNVYNKVDFYAMLKNGYIDSIKNKAFLNKIFIN